MNSELFNRRLKNAIDAMNFKEPEKVPVGFDYIYWPYAYAGKTLKELIEDPEENAKEYCRFMKEISFDITGGLGMYETYDVFGTLGSNAYSLCSDDCTVQHNQAIYDFMHDDEYEILIKDYGYFKDEYWPKRNIPAFSKSPEEAYAILKDAAKKLARARRFENAVTKIGLEEYSIVPMMGMGGAGPVNKLIADGELNQDGVEEQYKYGKAFSMYMCTLDTLHDSYRGMMGTFEDLIEQPEVIDEAIAAIDKYNFEQFSKMPPMPGPEGLAVPCCGTIFHSAPFLSPSQFDKYWFEGFKRSMLSWAEAGKRIYLKGESSFKHIVERFKEFPKGSVIIQLDDDDPFEMKKLIGDHQIISGGFRTSLFAFNDLEKCKDHVKRCFDELAPGGGYFFNVDKPLLSPADGEPSLVIDTWAYANECSEKH